MRLPTSVIVMSLLTAAPFGLAIRDTLRDTPRAELAHVLDYEPYRGGERSSAAERYERDPVREAEEEARERAQQSELLARVFGAVPASLGSLFDWVTIGTRTTDLPEDAISRLRWASPDGFLNPRLIDDGESVLGVTVEVEAEACDLLKDKLRAAWGPAVNGVWRDPATHQRASIEDDAVCTITIERYLDATDWVAALPWAAIGKPAAALTQSLGGRVTYSDDASIEWKLPGVGLATGTSTMSALVSDGKVTGFDVVVLADFDTQVAVREAISVKLAATPTHQLETYSWKHKKFPTMLATSEYEDRISLLVGKTGDE